MYITDNAIPGNGKLHEVIRQGKAAVYVSEPGGAMHYSLPVTGIDKIKNWCKGKRSEAALSAIREKGWICELVPAAFDNGKGASHPENYGLAVWPRSLCATTGQAMRRTTRAALFGRDRTA